MAPSIPEEIDVFTQPHTRMKELVNSFTQKMLLADLSNLSTLLFLLEELHGTLLEFRRHEAIENVLILDRLKLRIRQQNQQPPAKLGQCHDDDELPKLFEVVRRCEGVLGDGSGAAATRGGDSCAEVAEQLHAAYAHFLKHFLPHMKKEEQDFQPLLMNHFEYNELKALKNEVWRQHQLFDKHRSLKTKQGSSTKNSSSTGYQRELGGAKTSKLGQAKSGKLFAGIANVPQVPSVRSTASSPGLSVSRPLSVSPPLIIRIPKSASPSTDTSATNGVISALPPELGKGMVVSSAAAKGDFNLKTTTHQSTVSASTRKDASDEQQRAGESKVTKNSGDISEALTNVTNTSDYLIAGRTFPVILSRSIAFNAEIDTLKTPAVRPLKLLSFKPQPSTGQQSYQLNKATQRFTDLSNGTSDQCQANGSPASAACIATPGGYGLAVDVRHNDKELHSIGSALNAIKKQDQIDTIKSIMRSNTSPLSNSEVLNNEFSKLCKEDYNKQQSYYNNDNEATTNDMKFKQIQNYGQTSAHLQISFNHDNPPFSPFTDVYSSERYSESKFSSEENSVIHRKHQIYQTDSIISNQFETSTNVSDEVSGDFEENYSNTYPSSAPLLSLPHEVMLMILRFLNPKELMRVASVCSVLNDAVFDSTLWKELYPTQWAKGIWTWTDDQSYDSEGCAPSSLQSVVYDEDADSDTSQPAGLVCRHSDVMEGLVAGVCRRTGHGVRTIVLDGGGAVSSRALNKMLSLCPNVVTLRASYCSIDHIAFKGLWQNKALRQLKVLDLQGCDRVDDASLSWIALCAQRQVNEGLSENQGGYGGRSAFGDNKISKSSVCCGKSTKDNDSVAVVDELAIRKLRFAEYKRWLALGSGNTDDYHNLNNPSADHKTQNVSNANARAVGMNSGDTTPNNIIDNKSNSLWNFYSTTTEKLGVTSSLRPVIHSNVSVINNNCKNLNQTANGDAAPWDPKLFSINLSGCKLVSSTGLDALVKSGFLRHCKQINLSGCDRLTSSSINKLLERCPSVPYDQLTYCDNVLDVVAENEANGCDNLAHPRRYCCRVGN